MEQAAAEPAAAAPTGAKTVAWETGHERSPSNGRGGAAKKKGGEKGKQPRKHKPPSTEAAMRYRNITCPRELTTQGYRPYSVLKFQDDRFRRFGVGVMLYFKLLRRLQRQFMVMTLFALPALFFYTRAARLSDGNASSSFMSLESTTLGPMGYAKDSVAGVSKKTVGVLVSLLDVVGGITFLLFLWNLRKEQDEEAAKYEQEVLTVVNFTVKVTDVPTQCFDRRLIKEFFQQWGRVVDVAIATNEGDVVEAYKQRGLLKKRIAAADALGEEERAAELRKDLKSMDKDIAGIKRRLRREAVAWFVTFEFQHHAQECIDSFKPSFWDSCCDSSGKKFFGRRLSVSRAPEPSNILFLNLKYDRRDKRWRRCFSFIVSVTMVVGAMVAVFVAQRYQTSLPQEGTDCPADITRDMALNNTKLVDCFCKSIGATAALDDDLCNDWIREFALTRILILVSAFTIVAINVLLKVVTVKLGKFEKHFSVTSEQSAITKKLFVGLFVNSALVMVLVHANLRRYFGRLPLVLNGNYDEFVAEWFQVVGVSVIYTMLLNMFNPHIIPVIAMPFRKCRRDRALKTAKTQDELNQAYAGAEFRLAERYAALLNTVFVIMFYSSGMPVLYVIAAATFFLSYWCDKLTFFRHYRTPPRFDANLARDASRVMPYAVLVHFCVAIWFWSSPVMSSYTLGGSTSSEQTSASSTEVLNLGARIRMLSVLPTFIVLLAWAALRLLQATVLRFCKGLLRVFCCLRCCNFGDDNRVHPVRNQLSYTEARSRVKLESYHLHRQFEFLEAFVRSESNKQLKPEEDLLSPRQGEGGAPAPLDAVEQLQREAMLLRQATIEAAPAEKIDEEAAEPAEWSPGNVPARPQRTLRGDQLVANESSQPQASAPAAPSGLVYADGGPQAGDPTASVYGAAPQQEATLVLISCPRCSNAFQILDIGQEAEYVCPFCAASVVV